MTPVDVIVPCYNYGRYLHECVRSILSQQGCAVRVLIIDDCSTDDSLATAKAIAAEDKRVRLRPHVVNRGHIATYNEGLDWAEAPYMLLLSADDLLAPGALLRATRLMEAQPKVALVYGRSIRFTDTGGPPTLAPQAAASSTRGGDEYIEALCDRPVNPIDTATAVIRTRCQRQVGHYNATLPHAGDMEMWLRLAAIGDIGFVDGIQAFTRMHAVNMQHVYYDGLMLGDFRQRLEVFRQFFAGAGRGVEGAPRLATQVRRRLAAEMLWVANRALVADPATDIMPLLALARETSGDLRGRLGEWKFHARRLAGPSLWAAAGRAGDVLRRRQPR